MDNSLEHHGVKGQKWGVRRYQDKSGKRTTLGKARYAKTTPRKELNNDDYTYKKGTVVGRFGGDNKWDRSKDITYLYTNEKDRSVYSNRFGGNELTYKFKKDVKMPKIEKQYIDLLEFVKNDDAIKDQYNYAKDEPFDFWKDIINQGGKVADRYFSSMKDKGYDVLIDFRNVGMTDDPIIILSPKDSLTPVNKELSHSEVTDMHEERYLEHYAKGKASSNHKYISRFFKNGKWYYRYAKDAVKSAHDKAVDAEIDEIPNKIKDKAEDVAWNVGYDARQLGREAKWKAEDAKAAIDEKTGQAAKDRWYKSEREAQSARNVRNDTYFHNDKSEGAKSWNKIVDNDVKNKRDTARAAKQVYDATPMGKVEARVEKAKASANRFKKKLKHDDFSSTVITGQELIDNILGR